MIRLYPMAKHKEPGEESFAGFLLLAVSLIVGGVYWRYSEAVSGWAPWIPQFPAGFGWAAMLAVSIAYPIVGAIAVTLICSPLMIWGFDHDPDRSDALGLAAFWPISIAVLVIVCPAAGIIRRLF